MKTILVLIILFSCNTIPDKYNAAYDSAYKTAKERGWPDTSIVGTQRLPAYDSIERTNQAFEHPIEIDNVLIYKEDIGGENILVGMSVLQPGDTLPASDSIGTEKLAIVPGDNVHVGALTYRAPTLSTEKITTSGYDTVPRIIVYIDTSEQYYTGHYENGIVIDHISFYDYNAYWMHGYLTYELHSRNNTPGASDGTWNGQKVVYLDENKQRLSKNIIVIPF